jgi:hypothetical protein
MPGIEIKGRSKIANYRHGGRTGKFGGGRTNLLEELGRVEAEPSNRNRRAEISRVHGELNRGYATGGRVGLKKGGKPWGTGPKPGTHDYLMQQLHKRKGKVAGGVVKGGIKAGKRFLDFIKTGKHVDKKGVKTNVPKAAERLTGKPHVDRVKKAAGGWTTIPRILKKLDFPGDRTGKPHSSREGRRDSWVRGARRASESAKKIKEKMKPKRPSPQPLAKGGKADKNWIQKAVNPKHKGYCTPMTKKTCTPRRKALARTFKKKAKTGWS